MGGYVPNAGDVVRLDGAASPQFAGDRAINLRVIAVDTRSTYAGWLWLRGYELDAAGLALCHRDVFVEQDGLRLVSSPPRPESR